MHYFVFNNDMWVSTGGTVEHVRAESQKTFPFAQVGAAHVCVVDIDVLITVAPEEKPEQKDAILAKEFARVYPGDYILQEERIGANIFQVVGVKTQKVREIYGYLPGNRIRTFTPYAVAVRALLSSQNLDSKSIVVFLDDAGSETLITFYEGLKFSQTRRFNENQIEKILPEIKRSAIGFNKAMKRESSNYIILTNNREWVELIEELEPEQKVCHVDVPYPAIQGLKTANFPLKFELPEEILRRSKAKELKARIPYLAIASALMAFGVFLLIFYRVSLVVQTSLYDDAIKVQRSLEHELGILDQAVYRSALQSQKKTHYGDVYLWLQSVVPQAYEVQSLVFTSKKEKWYLELLLSLRQGQSFDDIPVRKPFTKMTVENVLIKDHPGKSIRIEL